jgi:hypothetical protein
LRDLPLSGGTSAGGARKRVRLRVIIALACVDAVLCGLWLLTAPPPEEPADRRKAEAGISRAVDTTLARHGVTGKDRRRWTPQVAGTPAVRIAERVQVAQGFPGLEFNKELSDRLRPFGAHVVATERTKESTVTYHIVRGGVTLRSLVCVVTP